MSNYFKEKEALLQKELGTQEAKRAQTEENVNETTKKMISSEESVGLYKSQVRISSFGYFILIILSSEDIIFLSSVIDCNSW